MRLSRTVTIPFAADVVFARARDELHTLADVLPDVASIEPLERTVDLGWTERVDRWRTRVLGASRRTLPAARVAWVATSRWDHESRRVSWQIEVIEPARGARSSGGLVLRPAGALATEVRIEMEIRLGGAAGATRWLSFAIRPMVERLVGQLVDRNLSSLLVGLEQAA